MDFCPFLATRNAFLAARNGHKWISAHFLPREMHFSRREMGINRFMPISRREKCIPRGEKWAYIDLLPPLWKSGGLRGSPLAAKKKSRNNNIFLIFFHIFPYVQGYTSYISPHVHGYISYIYPYAQG